MADIWDWYRERLEAARRDQAFWELVRLTEEMDLYDKHLDQRD